MDHAVIPIQETPYPLTATLISSHSSQDLKQPTKRQDVFDYSEETIVKLTKPVHSKTLTFDDQVEVYQDDSDSAPEDGNHKQTRTDDHSSLLDQPAGAENK